jgi:hypothetical protein
MRIVLPALAIVAALALPAHAQSAATGAAKDAARGPSTARLSADALCAKLTLEEVTAIVGRNFERRLDTEQSRQACRYGDSKEKGSVRVRYFSLGSSMLSEASWRKFVESGGKGKVIERDGVLVSHFRGNRFGSDSIWFKDRQGHALELNVNSGLTEDQAVALAKAAMD